MELALMRYIQSLIGVEMFYLLSVWVYGASGIYHSLKTRN